MLKWRNQCICVYLRVTSVSAPVSSRHQQDGNARVSVRLCEKEAKICNMDMDNFIVHGKLEDIYGDLAGDILKRFRKDFTHFTIKSKDHHS